MRMRRMIDHDRASADSALDGGFELFNCAFAFGDVALRLRGRRTATSAEYGFEAPGRCSACLSLSGCASHSPRVEASGSNHELYANIGRLCPPVCANAAQGTSTKTSWRTVRFCGMVTVCGATRSPPVSVATRV